MSTPLLLVLSSPSGVGKTTIARRLLSRRPDVGYSVSATTRARRNGEEDGRDYWFLTPEEFRRREAEGEFVETATYNGNRYGTLRSEIDRQFAAGRHVVMDIEVMGAGQVRRKFPESVHVFILPPSGAVLMERLRSRQTESPDALRRRLTHALEELNAVSEYQYVVVNDQLDAAVDEVSGILDAETRRVSRQHGLDRLVAEIRAAVGQALKS